MRKDERIIASIRREFKALIFARQEWKTTELLMILEWAIKLARSEVRGPGTHFAARKAKAKSKTKTSYRNDSVENKQ